MANEAVKVEGPYEVHDFTVADATQISAGTLCKLTEPRTAAKSTDADAAENFAGIAATEKVANNGKTELGLYKKGIFLLKCNAGVAISNGNLVSLSGANLIKIATEAEVVLGAVIGKAYENIAVSTTGEVHVGEVV